MSDKGLNFLGVRHVGLLTKDPEAVAAFYCDVLGMKVVRQIEAAHSLGATVFLARHPDEEDHDVVLVSNAAAAHTALRVASLADLLAVYQTIKARRIAHRCLNHGIALAIYFDDPEGHTIEVYWKSGRPVHGIHAEPIDLSVSEDRLHQEVSRLASGTDLEPSSAAS